MTTAACTIPDDRGAIIQLVNNLSYSIRMSCQTGVPVNRTQEAQLVALVDDCGVSLSESQELKKLTQYFLDHGYDDAWNIGNLLIGPPIL